ncbi:MAG: S8 family serine peptidase [Polyangiaceae bacterium]|nr:S8 family serine peptidase [Polyangiaceae bacterium]MCW5789637.1 S8 family serine peptidase [Polyangiaceae bacterium]
MRKRDLLCAWGVALALFGCGTDEPSGGVLGSAGASPGGAAGQGGVGGQGGSAGSAGSGGAGGLSDERGNPVDFPAECIESCEEACARLDECGGESSAYPIDRATCVAQCGMARGGPIWGDITDNFRCCTSQSSCSDVRNCGGFLKHPAPAAACKKLCSCLLGSGPTAPTPPPGLSPPAGYQFATDRAIVERRSEAGPPSGASSGALSGAAHAAGAPTTSGALSGGAPGAPGLAPGLVAAKTLFHGKYTALHLPVATSAEDFERAGLTLLPTFTDAAGRLVAGTRGLAISVSETVDAARLRALVEAAGLSDLEPLKYGRRLYYARAADGWAALGALHRLQREPGVRVELDMVRQHEASHLPLDPLYPRQWHLSNRGERDSVASVDGRVDEAWDLTLGHRDVIIAINDDGVAVDHEDLSFDILPPLNYPNGWEGRLSVGAFGGHGTAVAGVSAAAGSNGYGGSGVCPGCRVLPHWFGEFGASGGITDRDIADGFIRMVDAGAAVINNSWGAGGGDPRFVVPGFGVGFIPQLVTAAFDYAETEGRDGKGTVIVFASGNSNQIMNDYGAYPSVVGVAAVDDQGLKSYYSNYGPRIAVAAPSNGGLNGITTTSAPSGYTNSFGGTSSAAPFVSGVVGLIISANPALTAAEVRDILRATARPIDPVWGEWSGGVSPFYGAGLVNAYAAVKLALGLCTGEDCDAPSDTTGSTSGAQCDSCRTDLNCAEGYRCQALPALGRQVCVGVVTEQGCPDGTSLASGYCLPEPSTCGVCEAEERCNGRDDDCDGEIDEDDACTTAWCVQLGEGCAEDERCAGVTCAAACNQDEQCGAGERCDPTKTRYGYSTGSRGCNTDLSAGCPAGCELLASTLDDYKLQGFIDCMENGQAACSSAQVCAIRLPVQLEAP